MGYRIASFNIQKFSKKAVFSTSEKESRKDLDTIGEIIRTNDIDIIAIQEIFHKEALKELLEKISLQYAKEDRLKRGSKSYNGLDRNGRATEIFGYRTKHWEGRWAAPISIYGNNSAEGYAFIWNRDRIKLVTNYNNESFEPRISDYAGSNKLVRPPFVGRFMPVNGRCEFRLINTHIAWGVPSKAKDAETAQENATDIEFRKSEFLTLLDSIYTRLDDEQYDVNRRNQNARPLQPYTFLLGDYNLNLSSSDAKQAKLSEEQETYEVGKRKIVTVNNKLTTLKTKPEDPQEAALMRSDPVRENHLANNYDHFSYDEKKVFQHGISISTDVIYAFESYCNNETQDQSKYDLYREKVSDHLPVYLEVDIQKKRYNR